MRSKAYQYLLLIQCRWSRSQRRRLDRKRKLSKVSELLIKLMTLLKSNKNNRMLKYIKRFKLSRQSKSLKLINWSKIWNPKRLNLLQLKTNQPKNPPISHKLHSNNNKSQSKQFNLWMARIRNKITSHQ